MSNPREKARARYEFAPKQTIEGDDESGEYLLSEPQDFDAYCALLKKHELSERQSGELMLRMIEHFMDSVYKEEVPQRWVMLGLANAFAEVLNGGEWERGFPLPWTKFPIHLTEIEHRNLEIYCEVENGLMANPGANVTKLIEDAGKRWSVGYESARGAYYGWRNKLKNNDLKTE